MRRPGSASRDSRVEKEGTEVKDGKRKKRQISAKNNGRSSEIGSTSNDGLNCITRFGGPPNDVTIVVDRPPKAPPRSTLQLELEMPKRTTIDYKDMKSRGRSKSPQPSPSNSLDLSDGFKGLLSYDSNKDAGGSQTRGLSPTRSSFEANGQVDGEKQKRGRSSKRRVPDKAKRKNEAALESILSVDNGLASFSGLGELLKELDDGHEEDNFPKARGLVGGPGDRYGLYELCHTQT